MHKCSILISFLSLLLLASCGGSEDVLEKESPIIISQSIVNGAIDVAATPQKVLIVFDRAIRKGDVGGVSLEPSEPMDVSVGNNVLTIDLYEGLQYSTTYRLTVGAGAVKDKLTGGENTERVISFITDEKPYTPSFAPNYNLVTDNALSAARSIYDYLWRSNGHTTLSGASFSPKWNANDCDWVYRKTGKYPAIASFDYRYLYASPSASMNYTDTSMVEDWWQSGGLVAATWLWMVPKREGSSACTFNSEDTTLSVGNLLKEGCWESQVMQRDFEEMADILLLLQQKGIVVLWRPIPHITHSTNEPYYWWEREGGKKYRQLWRAMFDYFESRGVRNLIWIWTLVGDDVEYYPGNEYVDMIGGELHNKYYADTCFGSWENMKYWFPNKILLVSDLQKTAPIGQQLDAGAMWGAFVSAYDNANDGSDDYVHQAASAEWWSAAFADERVISRDELPNFEK